MGKGGPPPQRLVGAPSEQPPKWVPYCGRRRSGDPSGSVRALSLTGRHPCRDGSEGALVSLRGGGPPLTTGRAGLCAAAGTPT
eukprot:12349934-Alexandrium_andersonii.AAC.1